MAFNNYLEDENDKPYFTTNSLAYYYDKMEGFAKAVEGSAKALNLTKEEIEQRIALRLAEWDKNLESFDGSVEKLLSEWVDDGTLTHVIDSTLIEQKIAPVTAQLEDMAINVKNYGAVGDGVTNDTIAIQSLIDSLPINSSILFPAKHTFLVDSLSFTKPVRIIAKESKIIQSNAGGVNFISLTGNRSTFEGGELTPKTTADGLLLLADNIEVFSVQVISGKNGFEIRGDNPILSNCTSISADYSGARINLNSGTKKKKISLLNFTSLNFKFKGIVYNGTTGAEEILIENYRASTTSKEIASDCLLFDAGNGNENIYCVDRLIVKNAHMTGGESNVVKIYNVVSLEMHTIYANNDTSSYSSSAALRLNAKENRLHNIEIYNRIVAINNLYVNSCKFNAKLISQLYALELNGPGTKCDLINFDISKSLNPNMTGIIRIARNADIQHKLFIENLTGRAGVQPFAIFTYPPNRVGFIELKGYTDIGSVITSNSFTGTIARDGEIVRPPNTFRATALPTSGTYKRDDIIYRFNVTAGSNIGWICTTEGTFGTETPPVFKSFGTIEV